MSDRYDRLYVFTSFAIQLVLLVYFALRKWNFEAAMGVGWVVYALGIPAIIISVILYLGHKPWYLWAAGVLFAAWAVVGYLVDMHYQIPWRYPIRWSVLIPYISLYLSSIMFYWWPLGRIQRPLWVLYAALFFMSTYFNVTSHEW